MMPGLRPLLANERPDLAPIYANLEFKVDAGLTIR
jgi:hypothetical protein